MFVHGGITTKGLILLSKATVGETLTFTRMEYGAGELSGLSDCTAEEDYKALFLTVGSLVDKKADLEMYCASASGGVSKLVGNIKDDSVANDFMGRELAVYAKTDSIDECLFAYFTTVDYSTGTKVDTADQIYKKALEGQLYRVTINVVTANAQKITITYKNDNFATKEEVQNVAASVDALEESLLDKIKEVDDSHKELLKKVRQFDIVIDSNEKFLEWANCSDGSLKSVLVKSGTWTLDNKMINNLRTGSKYIIGEPGAKLVFNYQKGFGVGDSSSETFVIEHLCIEVNNTTDNDGYGVYCGGKLRDCDVKVTSSSANSYALKECSTDDCTASGITTDSPSKGYGFFDCSYCTRSRSGATASTTATWGGTNTKIDSNTCDFSA